MIRRGAQGEQMIVNSCRTDQVEARDPLEQSHLYDLHENNFYNNPTFAEANVTTTASRE